MLPSWLSDRVQALKYGGNVGTTNLVRREAEKWAIIISEERNSSIQHPLTTSFDSFLTRETMKELKQCKADLEMN